MTDHINDPAMNERGAFYWLRTLYMECLDDGHNDDGDPGGICHRRGMAMRCGICSTIDDVRRFLDSAVSDPQGWQHERERLHALIADCHSVIDPEQHPDLNARIDAVLLLCDQAGRCVAPPADEPKDV